MAAQEDTAIIASQLADLTRTVEQMAGQLKTLGERTNSQQRLAANQQERGEIRQERIDLAARELAEVSDRLQAAANALRGHQSDRPFGEGPRTEASSGRNGVDSPYG